MSNYFRNKHIRKNQKGNNNKEKLFSTNDLEGNNGHLVFADLQWLFICSSEAQVLHRDLMTPDKCLQVEQSSRQEGGAHPHPVSN